MSFSCPALSFAEMLAAARRFGYDGIEPRIDSGHAHGVELDASPAKRGEIRRQAVDAHIAVCCVATSCRFADPETVGGQSEVARRCIDLAANVGSPRVRVFGGPIPAGFDRERAIALVAASLRSLADDARACGVTLCLETHDDWTDPAHVAAVMRLADHPAVAVNWDIMHPVRQSGATIDQAYQVLRPWIRHVHFHDGTTREGRLDLVPVGQGEIDHRRAVQLLGSSGYDGYLSGEWIGWEPFETHLPRELKTMRSYE